MENKEVADLIKSGKEVKFEIFQNGKFSVSTLHFRPQLFFQAIYDLLCKGDLQLFLNDIDEKEVIFRLRNLAPDEDEIDQIRTALAEKNDVVKDWSDRRISSTGLEYFQRASDEILKQRLIKKYVRWVVAAMMKNFESHLESAFLQIFSATQMRAENEIREELGFEKIKREQMRDFVSTPVKNTFDITLDIAQGGKRKRKNPTWEDKHKISLYKTVSSYPVVEGKPIWEYAHERLIKENFDYRDIENLLKFNYFKAVPEKLFREAVKEWQNSFKSNQKLSDENSPKGFALRYTQQLLGYPKLKFSTLEKYFRQGKELSDAVKS